ncbi:MAG: polyprenyl synthetase family protein, partial [bacterium]
ASLFSACSGMGALLADADSRVLGSMLAFGENLGIAFQIRDDVLDLVADEHLLGKSVGADFRMGKLTLPLIHHLRVSDRMGGRDLLERLAEREGGVERLRFSLEGSGSMDYSLGKARQYARTAERCLDTRLNARCRDSRKEVYLEVADHDFRLPVPGFCVGCSIHPAVPCHVREVEYPEQMAGYSGDGWGPRCGLHSRSSSPGGGQTLRRMMD